jgi:hypothetical protein
MRPQASASHRTTPRPLVSHAMFQYQYTVFCPATHPFKHRVGLRLNPHPLMSCNSPEAFLSRLATYEPTHPPGRIHVQYDQLIPVGGVNQQRGVARGEGQRQRGLPLCMAQAEQQLPARHVVHQYNLREAPFAVRAARRPQGGREEKRRGRVLVRAGRIAL